MDFHPTNPDELMAVNDGGIWKSISFGLIISWICCYKGYYTKMSAEGLGAATTEAAAYRRGLAIRMVAISVLLATAVAPIRVKTAGFWLTRVTCTDFFVVWVSPLLEVTVSVTS